MKPHLSARTCAPWVRLAVSVPLLAGLLVLALPGAASARPARSWSFHIDYTINPVPDVACGGFAQTDVGTATGNGSLFRQGVWNSNECINIVTQPGVLQEDHGHFTIATRKGTLVGAYDGTGTPTGVGHLRTAATVRLTGGTGVFAGITGCGNALGDSNMLDTADNHLDASGRFGC
jgi:hypothetical protein